MIKEKILTKSIDDSIKLKNRLLNKKYYRLMSSISDVCVKTLKNRGKLVFCGNGGSAADAQHLAAELLVRLKPKNNRKPLPAISLNLDTSTITAIGNDFEYDSIYSRLIEALVDKNDLIFFISTSGNSKNIIRGAKFAKKNHINSISFTGNDGGDLKKYCNYNLIIPSKDTARIQECHIFFGHVLMDIVERDFL